MRYFRLFMTLAIITLALGYLSASAAGVPPDSLWIKAVALSDLNDDLVPGLIKMHMQEVDGDGRPKDKAKYHEVWTSLKPHGNGEVDYETVKVVENGKDVTAEARAREEKAAKDDEAGDGEDSPSESVEGYNPFEGGNQHRISIEPLGDGGVIGGKSTVIYGFTEHTDENVINGKAWLEAATGVPVRVEYTPDPLPKRVKHMITTLDYEYQPPDSLIVTRMDMQVTGGILFIKKHFHMNMSLEDYWRLRENEDGMKVEGR